MAMGMPTGQLSSNWELLRKRLDAAAPPKRKPAAADKEEPAKKKLKRRRANSAVDTVAAKKPKPHRDSSSSSAPRKHIASMSAAADEQNPATTVSTSLALWAEGNDIPAEDVARAYGLPLNTTKIAAALVRGVALEPEAGSSSSAASRTESGRYVAMDCEMVGVGGGERESSALARVSIVNFHGHCVLDCFVRPKEKVTDWRTWVSGVSPKDMVNAITFEEAQKKVADILDGRILVGHAIKNDLDCLLIGHPKRDIRDTSRHPEFRKYSKGHTPALKKLAKEILGIEIQGGAHSSIEDARACMRLYRRFKDDFERENQIRFPNKLKKFGGGGKKKKNKK